MKWISTEERLPEFDKNMQCMGAVLVFENYGNGHGRVQEAYAYKWKGKTRFSDDGYLESEKVTHWMPMPDPPTASINEELDNALQ